MGTQIQTNHHQTHHWTNLILSNDSNFSKSIKKESNKKKNRRKQKK